MERLNDMNIYAKIGTMPLSVVRIKSSRLPLVGDWIRVYDKNRWIRCKVDMIKDFGYPVYYLSKL